MTGGRVAAVSVSLTLLAGAWLHCAHADAQFTPATLLSGTSQLQFSEADSPAYSHNGRYVVFRGSLAGVTGVWRRDLQNGEVAPVAVGAGVTGGWLRNLQAGEVVPVATPGGEAGAGQEEGPSAPDAAAPSVSETGQYIAFTSAAVLDPGEDTGSGCPQVYVRNMDVPASQTGAYTLVSAVSGSDEGLSYATSCAPESPTELAFGGSQAAPGVAISAEGNRVVFTVLSQSNLMTGPKSEPQTPARQVAVRDLQAKTTTLVSATPEGEPTPGGGAYPSLESEPVGAAIQFAVAGDQPTASSAAISADGSTVAWEGTNVPEQVPSATDVTAEMASLGGPGKEVEPLWRRVADGPEALTRRLLAGAGLNFYFVGGVVLGNTGAVLGGAFSTDTEREFVPPALSENGSTVATIANAPTPAGEQDYLHDPLRIANGNPVPPTDAYLALVPADPNAPISVRALTATPSFAMANVRSTGVNGIAISPDGLRVAFNTVRTRFALPTPLLTTPPTEEGDFAYTYEVNLPLDSMQRVTSTFDGTSPLGEPQLLSFSGEDSALAVASSASNLFYGDGTPGVSQVYLVREVQTSPSVSEPLTSPMPSISPPQPSWVLSASAQARPDGSVIVYAAVPGAGRLAVSAAAQLPAGGAHGRKLPVLERHTIAQTELSAGAPSDLSVTLRAGSRYSARVSAKTGLYCVLRVAFAAQGHKTLVREIPVTLRRVKRASRKARRARSVQARGGHR
jgi:hypothetical protein